jgi:hypothetical protein
MTFSLLFSQDRVYALEEHGVTGRNDRLDREKTFMASGDAGGVTFSAPFGG